MRNVFIEIVNQEQTNKMPFEKQCICDEENKLGGPQAPCSEVLAMKMGERGGFYCPSSLAHNSEFLMNGQSESSIHSDYGIIIFKQLLGMLVK